MIGWFICPYKRRIGEANPTRYCAMDDHTATILADGGDWSETEVLGDVAIVKVRASASSLTSINASPGFLRIPVERLDDSLASLSPTAKTVILTRLQSMGYSIGEIAAALPNDLGTYTLRDVLRFASRRRLKPRYDVNSDVVVCDGPIQPVRPIEEVDASVT